MAPVERWSVGTKSFTASVAQAMARDRPDRYVTTVAKRVRRGRIFIDYLRNNRKCDSGGPIFGARIAASVRVDVLRVERTLRRLPR